MMTLYWFRVVASDVVDLNVVKWGVDKALKRNSYLLLNVGNSEIGNMSASCSSS